MTDDLPFASASMTAGATGLIQQPGLNLIRGRGGQDDVNGVGDGQASAVVQVRADSRGTGNLRRTAPSHEVVVKCLLGASVRVLIFLVVLVPPDMSGAGVIATRQRVGENKPQHQKENGPSCFFSLSRTHQRRFCSTLAQLFAKTRDLCAVGCGIKS